MKIAIGSDHGGFLLKEEIKSFLNKEKIDFIDYGCDSTESVDYPVYAKKVSKSVSENECDFGILVCTTGVGMSIVANKQRNVRAVLCSSIDVSHMSREHNNCNVLCLGSKYTTIENAEEYIKTFINTPFAGGRHLRRVNMFE